MTPLRRRPKPRPRVRFTLGDMMAYAFGMGGAGWMASHLVDDRLAATQHEADWAVVAAMVLFLAIPFGRRLTGVLHLVPWGK